MKYSTLDRSDFVKGAIVALLDGEEVVAEIRAAPCFSRLHFNYPVLDIVRGLNQLKGGGNG